MELKEILAISGQPGLYKYVAQSGNGVIVESLIDGRRSNATGTSKVSALAEIAIFTDEDELPLWKVLQAVYEKTDGKEAISPKSSSEQLKSFFAEVVPNYDRDRVHVSDMKKLFSWYNVLIAAGMTDFTVKEEAETETETSEE